MVLNITDIEEQVFQIFKLLTKDRNATDRVRDILGDVYEVIYRSYLEHNEPTEFEV